MKNLIIALFLSISIFANSQELQHQKLSELKVSRKNFATVEAITNHGIFNYHLNNTGEVEV